MTTMIDPALYKRAFACVGHEATRHYLSGVRVEPHPEGGAMLIATDGALMAVIRDPKGFCDDPVTIRVHPRDLAQAFRRGSKSRPTPNHRVVESGGRVGLIAETAAREWSHHEKDGRVTHLTDRDATEIDTDCVEQLAGLTRRLVFFEHVDGTVDGFFPDWRAAIKGAFKPEPRESVSFMTSRMAALRAAIGDHVTMFVSEGTSASMLVSKEVDGFALLMGARDDGIKAPAWFAGLIKEPAA